MSKLRLFLVILLAVLIMVPGVAQAARGDREELNFGYVKTLSTNADGVLSSGPQYLYAVTIYPAAANSYVLLYNNSSAATVLSDGHVSVEVGEAVQYTTKREVFDPPILMDRGIYADVTNGHVVIEYR